MTEQSTTKPKPQFNRVGIPILAPPKLSLRTVPVYAGWNNDLGTPRYRLVEKMILPDQDA